jgi:hypothetical protein
VREINVQKSKQLAQGLWMASQRTMDKKPDVWLQRLWSWLGSFAVVFRATAYSH